jgi:hypothetical protein
MVSASSRLRRRATLGSRGGKLFDGVSIASVTFLRLDVAAGVSRAGRRLIPAASWSAEEAFVSPAVDETVCSGGGEAFRIAAAARCKRE